MEVVVVHASVHVAAPSRIAITLLDMNGELGRVDGCVGFALEHPTLRLSCNANDSGSEIIGVGSEYLERVQRVIEQTRNVVGAPPVRLKVTDAYGAHQGLGFGTQLLVAASRTVAMIAGKELAVRDAARIARRGGTSGIGVAIHENGGFVIDGGHSFGAYGEKSSFAPSRDSAAEAARLTVRLELPTNCAVVCATVGASKLAGLEEARFFRENCPVEALEVGEVCRIVLMVLLPAIVSRDISELNRSIGLIQETGFKRRVWAVQGREVHELSRCFIAAGMKRPGLSSMGPTLYSFTDVTDADGFVRGIQLRMPNAQVWHTRVSNTGARYQATSQFERDQP